MKESKKLTTKQRGCAKASMMARLLRRVEQFHVDALRDLATIAELARPDDLIDWAHALRSRRSSDGF